MFHKVNQYVATEFVMGRVKGPSPVDFGDLFDEGIVRSLKVQRKGIDGDIGFGAANYFSHR